MKLNIFQHGILQAIFSVGLASLLMFAGQIIFIRLYISGLFAQDVITIIFVMASSLAIVAISLIAMK